MKICVTGGIASGKSLLSRYLNELGVETIDADDIVVSTTILAMADEIDTYQREGVELSKGKPSLKELSWSLIRNKLTEQAQVKIEDADVKNAAREAARAQFAQYGMNNVPDEYVDNYADELLKKQETVQNFVDRAIDVKLIAALKSVVKLNKKDISLDDFNKLMGE